MSDLRSKSRVVDTGIFKRNSVLFTNYDATAGMRTQRERQKQVEPSQCTCNQQHIQVHALRRTSLVLPSLFEKSGQQTRCPHATPGVCSFYHDTQTGMLPGYPESAICVQRFDDSLNSAIHTTYRNWLRSSSMHEPRDPPLEVVTFLLCCHCWLAYMNKQVRKNTQMVAQVGLVETI